MDPACAAAVNPMPHSNQKVPPANALKRGLRGNLFRSDSIAARMQDLRRKSPPMPQRVDTRRYADAPVKATTEATGQSCSRNCRHIAARGHGQRRPCIVESVDGLPETCRWREARWGRQRPLTADRHDATAANDYIVDGFPPKRSRIYQRRCLANRRHHGLF